MMADISAVLQSMELRFLLPSAGVFLAIVLFALGAIIVARGLARKRVADRLQDVILIDESESSARETILRDLNLSSVPAINALLMNVSWARRLDNLLVQGDMPMRLGSYVALMLLLGALGFVVTSNATGHALLALPVAGVCSAAPVFYARHRKIKRVHAFERQFPDALDMLTGALRAGLAMASAMQVVADESPDPVGREFAILSEETRLGLDMKEALRKLAGRVDSNELRLFVTAVILQRETGGNLPEILENTSTIIRDRFRILGDVRSMTAHARFSGFTLTVLPLAMAGVILFVAPEYLRGMWNDPLGPMLVISAVVMQIVGFLIMRRIINIKV